jgi:hypothetical protein
VGLSSPHPALPCVDRCRHQAAAFETPAADADVRAVWSGIRRRQGMAAWKMRAARTKVITAMVASLDDGLAEVRDRTLLLCGFAQRSSLCWAKLASCSEPARCL